MKILYKPDAETETYIGECRVCRCILECSWEEAYDWWRCPCCREVQSVKFCISGCATADELLELADDRSSAGN